MPLTAEEQTELESLEREFKQKSFDETVSYIRPEVAAKKTTSGILSSELGLDINTVSSSYSSLVKNIYGESLSPIQVQERMQEDGLLANPKADEDDMNVLANAVMSNTDPPEKLMEKRRKQKMVRLTSDIFHNLQKIDEDLFHGPTTFAAKMADKPDDPNLITSLPPYTDEDLLDEGSYMNLLEQAGSKQHVAELRQERKSIVQELLHESVRVQGESLVSEGLAKFTNRR